MAGTLEASLAARASFLVALAGTALQAEACLAVACRLAVRGLVQAASCTAVKPFNQEAFDLGEAGRVRADQAEVSQEELELVAKLVVMQEVEREVLLELHLVEVLNLPFEQSNCFSQFLLPL